MGTIRITPLEEKVLKLSIEGLEPHFIAERLSAPHSSVWHARRRICEKFNIRSESLEGFKPPKYEVGDGRRTNKWLSIMSLALLLAGCSDTKEKHKDYYMVSTEHPTGVKFAQCQRMWYGNCGVYLDKCTDGSEYTCMQNVKERNR